MVTYYEIKSLLRRILRTGRIDGPDDEDLAVDLKSIYRHGFRIDDQKDGQLVIANKELFELYQTVYSMQSNGLQLYTGRSFEVAINIDPSEAFPPRHIDYPLVSEDAINCIRYEIGLPSAEYTLYILSMVAEILNQQVGKISRIPTRLRMFSDRISRNSQINEDSSLSDILSQLIGEQTLRISYLSEDNYLSFKDFCTYKNSFEFEFMYKTGKAIVDFSEIGDIFPSYSFHGRHDPLQIDAPPLRKYSEDVVDYYKQALESSDPYIKYISFYHVIEYFFDEVFKRKMVADLRNRITHPDFSYRNDEKIYDIALFVKNRLRMNDETGQGDEREALKYVLAEYVPIEDLKARIQTISPNSMQYYQNNKVAFCNAPVIGWSDLQGVYTNLAKRIYFTRNALVHSKSGKNAERYRPYKDEKQLVEEIPLVKAVAELIIINWHLRKNLVLFWPPECQKTQEFPGFFGCASFLHNPFGAGSRSRTGTPSLAADFE